jgi:hypothetical protein
MKIKITLSKIEQVEELKKEIENTRTKYTNNYLTLDYEQPETDKRIFVLTLKYPSENRIFNWQLFRSIKDQFQKEDKTIKVEHIK